MQSFNGKLRDECLNTAWFTSLRAAQHGIELSRRDYNDVRPHKNLGRGTPTEFTKSLEQGTLSSRNSQPE